MNIRATFWFRKFFEDFFQIVKSYSVLWAWRVELKVLLTRKYTHLLIYL